ncbi:MAG: MFS transporter [Oscillatoriaceae bacterium SKW80]|nr:MFS transporter [Oscillatoriaceae bacterium SKYG93]MCX8120567.1 MFS transporter [Oscillatoriaceae bacterium SKW80]MDW8453896.1 MFS transporter [Oscillatoriaceae cyanobacterium SKYGB_i_bin93]
MKFRFEVCLSPGYFLSSTAMLRAHRLLILLSAGSLTTMAGGVFAPVLPEVVKQLHLDPALAGSLVSIHCLTIALFSAPLGILADRFGRLRVLVLSLLFYALFGVAGAQFSTFWLLLATRALLGVASGGIAAASMGLLASLYTEPARTQALAYATSTLALAGILFPLLGGWVGTMNWHYVFYLYAVGVPLALLALLILKEKQSQENKEKGLLFNGSQLAFLFKHYQTLHLLVAISISSAIMYGFLIYVPFYLKAILASNTFVNGVVLASTALGAAFVSALGTSRFIQKWGFETAIAFGFGLMATMFIAIAQFSQLIFILPAALIFGVGFGLVLPSLYAALANIAPAELRSTVLAAGTGSGFLGQFLSPLFLGPILSFFSFKFIFYAVACVALATGLLLLLLDAKNI